MYDTILVPTDGSDAAGRAADEAFRLAAETGATVHLLFVIDESAASFLLSPESMGERLDRLRERAAATLAEVAEEAPGVEVETAVTRGLSVYRGIVDYADRAGVDLIVMGSTGRDGPGGVLGSTTQRVTEHTSVPVLVVSDAGVESATDAGEDAAAATGRTTTAEDGNEPEDGNA